MWRRRRVASVLFAGAVVVPTLALAEPTTFALGEGERVHGPLGVSYPEPLHVHLEALRGETVSFQLVIEEPEGMASDVSIDLDPLEGREGRVAVDPFVEHFVDVTVRSRNLTDPMSSLGWAPPSRPPDADVMGKLPDALIPLRLAACPQDANRLFCPYPMHLAGRDRAAMWFDLFVPLDAKPGRYANRARVLTNGRLLSSTDIELDVLPARLPDVAVSFFAYYAADTLQKSFSDAARAERSVWTTLHTHHVDAVTALTSEADVTRIAEALSGALFAEDNGYRGPGAARPPEVVAVGAYGSLGDATPDRVEDALAIRHLIPASARDVFLYAVDEQCESARGPDWRRALDGKLSVAQTCGNDPRTQPVDVVMMPADAFQGDAAKEARTLGKRVFVYNGRLPFAGPMMIDAPATSLTADGWIAASYDVGRWFLWETTFWNDDNRGGRGPRDVFSEPETFHNADGDACLGDGLLLYPGRLRQWPAHSLEADEVLPSMRLKALRRGIEDAALLAVAASLDREKALEIDERIVGAALDEADIAEPAALRIDASTLAGARTDLKAIIGRHDVALTNTDARALLADLQAARRARRSVLPRDLRGIFVLVAPLALLALGFAIAASGALRTVRLQSKRR